MNQARTFCKTLLRPSLASLQRQSVHSQRCLVPASWRFGLSCQPSARWFSDSAAAVPAKLVKELRDRTGASMGKCRDALKEEGGDLEKAVEWLKKRGVRSMEKRTAESAEALIGLGMQGDSGAILEIKAETDFVTRSEMFQQVLLFLARSIAASPPGPAESIQSLILEDGPGRPQQLTTGIALPEALLELGSVLGEKLLLGEVQRLAAADAGVIGGYVHPKSADGMAGTGRMAALVSLRPLPSEGFDSERLRATAAHLARHVVAAQPRFVSVESIPAQTLRKEREVFRAAYLEQLGSRKAGAVDEKVVQKVLDGKTHKFYQESVLACQELVAPQVSTGAKSEQKPIPVSEWLQDEAKSLGLEQIVLEDFRLYVI